MSTVIVTGAAGLIGSESVKRFAREGFRVAGIDNDLRRWFFGDGEVYNIGGSRHSNCSLLEAIDLCEQISSRKLKWTYEENNRIGDHIRWISDVRKFQSHYPAWKFQYNLGRILEEIHHACLAS